MNRLLAAATLALGTLALAAPDGGTASAKKAPIELPAMTPQMTTDFLWYVEWVVDTHVTASQREEMQKLFDKAWADKNAWEVAVVQEAIASKNDLANHSESDLKNLRTSVQDEWMKSLRRRADKGAIAKWVISVNDASTKALVGGKPPLTRQMADALAEMMAFVCNETKETNTVAADKAFRDGFAKSLASDYKAWPDEAKLALADLPKDWAALRTGFAGFPEDKKTKLRGEWREALASVKVDAMTKPKGLNVQSASAKVTDGGVVEAKPELPTIKPEAKSFREASKALVVKATMWL
jgi:hypothetical protein